MEAIQSFGPLIAMAVAFYVLIIMPNQKKQKQLKDKLSKVKKGDKIVTVGGIIGVVESVDGEAITLKIDDKTKMKLRKSAIAEFDVPAADALKPVKK